MHENPLHQVLADELELDGRCVLEAAGLRVTIQRLHAPPLSGSSSQIRWARELRALDVRGFFAYCLEQAAARRRRPLSVAEVEAQLPALAASLQPVLELPATLVASWWIDRRPQRRDDIPGLALRPEARRFFSPQTQVPDHLTCTAVPL